MGNELFSPVAIDALGEMMNISLGSSATAVSNMLDKRVSITTPKVEVIKTNEFNLGEIAPVMGVEIKYVEGLDGSNIMLLKRGDIKVIVDILLGTETPDEEFELNEMTTSCICEVMNQMMGAASTAMSDFLGYSVNISTPEPFELNDMEKFKREHMPNDSDTAVVVKFSLSIPEVSMESGFMNVISVTLAKKLLAGFGIRPDGTKEGAAEPAPQPAAAAPSPTPPPPPAPDPFPEPSGDSNRVLSQEEIERLINSAASAAPPPAPAPAQPAASAAKPSQEVEEKMTSGSPSAQTPAPAAGMPAAQVPQQMPPFPMPGPDGTMQGGYMGYPPMYYPPYPYPYPPQGETKAEPKVINTSPMPMPQLDAAERLGKEQAQNLDLIMEVPLQVTVEIGRTRRKVQDILEFAKGSLVVLDKLAGDQVDLFVNGKCIARGEVVVIEDNFGVRITEIVQTPGIEILAKKS